MTNYWIATKLTNRRRFDAQSLRESQIRTTQLVHIDLKYITNVNQQICLVFFIKVIYFLTMWFTLRNYTDTKQLINNNLNNFSNVLKDTFCSSCSTGKINASSITEFLFSPYGQILLQCQSVISYCLVDVLMFETKTNFIELQKTMHQNSYPL